ncbi:MAG: alpha/beta hydrolase [Bacteroidia bacterium]|nr:alpha/beta hydrolase [Bacteroidia bacterium]
MKYLHHEVFGKGEPLIAIHGFLVCGEMYYPLLEYYTKDFQVILPDLRGYGKSQDMPGPYSIKQHATDIVSLLDYLEIPKAHILGYSKGGLVAQQLAVDYPERVETLVLACTFAYRSHTVLERLQRKIVPDAIERLGAKGLAKIITQEFSGGPYIHETIFADYKRMVYSNRDDRIVEGARVLLNYDIRHRLQEIKADTLVISARNDRVVLPHHHEILITGIPQARHLMFENAGHSLLYSHTKEFTTLTKNFFLRKHLAWVNKQEQRSLIQNN